MKISVIIPTYNRAHVICEALDSVLAQTYKDFEVIIVDDGSTDDTEKRIKPYLTDTRFRYVKQKNAGVSAARNKGVELAVGEIISFLDSDDLWRPGKLDCEVDFLKKNSDIQVVFSDTEVFKENSLNPSWMKTRPIFLKMLQELTCVEGLLLRQRDMFLYLIEEFPIRGCNFSLTRQVFFRAGMFDETFTAAEDWDLFLRLSLTEDFRFINKVLVTARESEDSLNCMEKEKSYLSILESFLNMKKCLVDSSEEQAALHRSIINIHRQLYRYYLNKGLRLAASKVCLRGYMRTRSVEMLLRLGVAWFPVNIRNKAKFIVAMIVPRNT